MSLENQRSIVNLPEYLEALPEDTRRIANRIIRVSTTTAPMCYSSDDSLRHVATIFRTSPENMQSRRGVRVTNLVLDQETLFNPVRSNRPMMKVEDGEIDSLEKNNPRERCDLCRPEDMTPLEIFGRVRGEVSVSTANAGAYDGWHGLIIPTDIHNPQQLTREVFTDMIHTANEWFREVYKYNPEARFPIIGFNAFGRAGASLFHPHLQVLAAEGYPYQPVEDIRRRMADYQWFNNGHTYLQDFADVMRNLGLVSDEGTAHTIFNITPRKEKEVVIYTDDQKRMPNGDLSCSIFNVVEWWRKEFGVTSFNMAIFMPPLGEDFSSGSWTGFYPFARLVERGKEGTLTSDMGVMETYLSPVVAADPFVLADRYKRFIE